MVIIEWVVWALTCLILLSFLLAGVYSHDPGLRGHHFRHCLLLGIGLVITVIADISKLHLLWWVPITFFLNIVWSNILVAGRLKRGLREFENQRHDKPES